MLMLLPIAGLLGGIRLWSRVVHMAIGLSGLTPYPPRTDREFAPLLRAFRRLVLVIAAAWAILFGAVLAYMLFTGKTGWALLFGGIFIVPLLTVTSFFVRVRRYQKRAAAAD